MPFNDLHTDIIEIIFYIHVHIHQGSRRSLLLTCHRWHSVAINCTSLWRSIVWCCNMCQITNSAQCESLRGLAYLIARTGNATFDLSLGWWLVGPTRAEIEHFITSVEPNWLSRCRSFTVNADQTYVYEKEIAGLFIRGSFDQLERFTWHLPEKKLLQVDLSRLMDHLGTTAPHLRELEIMSPTRAISALSQLICILGRIRRLRVVTDISLPGWGSHLTNIEHLDVNGDQGLFATLLSPHLTSLVLRGWLRSSMLPPTAMLEKLTHLTMGELDMPRSRETSLYLPSVQCLTFQFLRWDPYSGVLHAENLKELTLFDTSGAREPILRFGPGVAPRIVNLFMAYYSLYQLRSPRYAFWIKMVELHVTVCRVVSGIAATVAIALREEGFAPQLSCLTVRYDAGGIEGVQSHKREWVDELRSIMTERVSKGMKPFERLEVGWFDQLKYGYKLQELTETLSVTHWTDCLRE